MSKPRLVLADDDFDTAGLLYALLKDDFDVVALVHDGIALMSAVERLAPDVIVTDISMPGIDGLSAATVILRKQPQHRIVLISVACEPGLAERCTEIGACGFVLKHLAGEELIDAIHSALRGTHYSSATPVEHSATR